ncbi:1,4-alpha-glucan branching enzyme [Emticicia aquatilis]|uniref:1,4-alpha-glucan branching enzyme n=1 Tax=Emticicia aquatilis TaxID=1537369 RepID=A0A917DKT7_9BACT|nr:alpha-amylase family glycosyl hydrolase [Emticicia aquatilis]GGD46948.1 1,4-alpha-glucan branching enzyme [Emticicia aquatilis]
MEAISTIKLAEISKISGMGAIVHPNGVSFRVWAPNAEVVFVVGDFNEWDSEATPLTNEGNGYWSADVVEAKAEQNYKYRLCTPFGEFLRNDPYAKQLTNSIGNSIIMDTTFEWENDHDFVMPNFNEMVIYELHIGTFNVKEDGKPGDFYGAIERLEYLKSLGINAIEIMPIAEFPGGFSWGYNPAHPFAVESEYGGVAGLKEFVKVAHKQGIAVIIDVVYNHFGPTDMDLWQFDGWHEDNMGGIYFYNDWRSKTPWGDTRPDYGRPEVRQYIRDNALYWLEEFHIDGLRMDMIPYIRNVNADGNPNNDLQEGYSLIQWINSEIKSKFGGKKFTVAEDLHSLNSITAPIENGGLGYSSQWTAEFVHPIRDEIIKMNDGDRNMDIIAQVLTHKYNHDVFERVIYTESHDEVSNGKARVVQEIAGQEDVNTWFAKKRSTLGAALMLTAPGIPMIFQGQDMLEDSWFQDTDPIDWSRISEFKGITKLYRDLIYVRLNKGGFSRGLMGQHIEILKADNQNKVIAYHRWMDGGVNDSVVVVMNFSQKPIENYLLNFPLGGVWINRFNSDWNGYNSEFDNQESSNAYPNQQNIASVSIGAYSVLIYSKSE